MTVAVSPCQWMNIERRVILARKHSEDVLANYFCSPDPPRQYGGPMALPEFPSAPMLSGVGTCTAVVPPK